MLQQERKLAGYYMEEKNWCERFSQIIFPSFPFFWQDASIDSLVEGSNPARLDDWNTRTIPARVNASNKVPMIVLFRMYGWFLSIWRRFAVKCYIKDKKPGKWGKQMLTESGFLPMKCGKGRVNHLWLARKNCELGVKQVKVQVLRQ